MTGQSGSAVQVFISCPGDLGPQRRVVEAALLDVNAHPEFAGRIQLIAHAYDNDVPARAGMDAQDVVNSYMLRPEDADLFICMFWRRMGTPMARFIDPGTNRPYQSGTEYEFLSAYAAAQRVPTPVLLLYRCRAAAPPSADDEERAQVARVEGFFARFGPGGDLKGLHADFADDGELAMLIRRDVARVLRDDLLPLLERRRAAGSPARGGSIRFGLPPLPAGYIPRTDALDALRESLLGSRQVVGIVAASALVGIGGLGKTVLARAICDDPALQARFPDGVLWATLGQTPDITRVQREWIRALGGDYRAASSPEGGQSELQRLIYDRASQVDRALLLVLDDLWRADDATPLQVAGPRCRVLITTRDAGQVEGAALVPVELMRRAEARALLREAARMHGADEATLDAVAARLGDLPLALQVVGALLGRGIPWAQIARELDGGHLPDVADRDRSIFTALGTSVRYLPADQRERYRELVIFPEDEPLVEAAVARLWARTGGLSAFAAKRLLAELRERSLLQAGNTLHDLQVDYLRAVVPETERPHLHDALCVAYGDVGTWATLPDDDERYGWRRLASHLQAAGRSGDLVALLTDGTYLEGKLSRLGSMALAADLALCPADAAIQQLAAVVRAGAAVLDQEPRELANQVMGRVGGIPRLHRIPEPPMPYFRLYTVSLPPTDAHRTRDSQSHTGPVNGCAFGPDGRTALSASSDGTLRLWDVGSGRALRVLEGHTGWVNGCAFGPDGRTALSASSDGTLRLWDLADGREIRRMEGHTDRVTSCAFGPDGRTALSGSYDGTLRLWDVHRGQCLHALNGLHGWVTGCALGPDGRTALAAHEDGALQLWELVGGQSLRVLVGHTGWVTGCAFGPDGDTALSASWDGTLRTWDLEGGGCLRVLKGHIDPVTGCAFGPDGDTALSASWDGTLRTWDVEEERPLARWLAGTYLLCAAFDLDGRQVIVGDYVGGVHLLRLVRLPTVEGPASQEGSGATGGSGPHPAQREERPVSRRRRFWPFRG